EARARYEAAAELAPDSPYPHRRICTVELALERKVSAVKACEAAHAKRNDPVQQSMLALALIARPVTDQEKRRAVDLANAAAKKGDLFSVATQCEVALTAENTEMLSSCTHQLDLRAPSAPFTHVML